MNLTTLKTNIQANAPQILLWGGTASIIAGGIGIIFATRKQIKLNEQHRDYTKSLDEKLEEANERLQRIIGERAIKKEKEELKKIEEEVLVDHKRETVGYVVKTIINVAIPAGLMAAGICMHHKSFQIISGRLAVTAAALATTKSIFETYRKRVIEDQGVEKIPPQGHQGEGGYIVLQRGLRGKEAGNILAVVRAEALDAGQDHPIEGKEDDDGPQGQQRIDQAAWKWHAVRLLILSMRQSQSPKTWAIRSCCVRHTPWAVPAAAWYTMLRN